MAGSSVFTSDIARSYCASKSGTPATSAAALRTTSRVSDSWLANSHASSFSAVPFRRAMTIAEAASHADTCSGLLTAALHSGSSGKCFSTYFTLPWAMYLSRIAL
jgi:hypothetical protein